MRQCSVTNHLLDQMLVGYAAQQMPDLTCGTKRSFFQRIGWNWISAALGLCIMIAAAATLFQLARDVEIDKIFATLDAIPLTEILLAGSFIAGAYVMLTFYDFFALRTIGRTEVPYRIAALAGLTSYTVGHNLGATVLTGGVIRYRIYSGWGLGLIEVAKIAFITGLTFWLGNAFLLGGGMAYVPAAASAVNHLPPWVNRAIGLTALAAIIGYLCWLTPCRRVIGRANWRVALPSFRLTFVQIGIGVADLGLVALAMYVLLPASPAVDFVTLLVIFVTATLLGFLSHAPGSLGVIEAAMLLGLPQFGKEELLASVLMFRFLYFIVPLFAAATVLALREIWIGLKAR